MSFVVGMVLLLPANAHAEEWPTDDDPNAGERARQRGGFEWGARTGVALPFGRLHDGVDALLPIRIHLGARSDSHALFVGGYGQLGALACTLGSSCWGLDARAGGELHWHPLPDARVDPWFSTGLGVEVAQTSTTTQMLGDAVEGVRPTRVGWAVAGVNWDIITFGVSFRLGRHTYAGPFVSLDAAQLVDTSSTRSAPDGGREGESGINVWTWAGFHLTNGP